MVEEGDEGVKDAKRSDRENFALLCQRMRLKSALISSFSLGYIIW